MLSPMTRRACFELATLAVKASFARGTVQVDGTVETPGGNVVAVKQSEMPQRRTHHESFCTFAWRRLQPVGLRAEPVLSVYDEDWKQSEFVPNSSRPEGYVDGETTPSVFLRGGTDIILMTTTRCTTTSRAGQHRHAHCLPVHRPETKARFR